MEEWKQYSDGLYVSNMGRVVRDNKKKGYFNPHFVNDCYTKDGYKKIKINKKTYTIHRIVGKMFIPNPDKKPEIDHIDRTRDFNMITNLRWVTRTEQNNNKNCINIAQSNNKLNERYICKIKERYRLRIKRLNLNKFFYTLNEAIIYRNNLI